MQQLNNPTRMANFTQAFFTQTQILIGELARPQKDLIRDQELGRFWRPICEGRRRDAFSAFKTHHEKSFGECRMQVLLKRPDSSTTNSLAHSLPPSKHRHLFFLPLFVRPSAVLCGAAEVRAKLTKLAKICPWFYCLCGSK
jgi:hypothetical protein